jgi:hypothetical protein
MIEGYSIADRVLFRVSNDEQSMNLIQHVIDADGAAKSNHQLNVLLNSSGDKLVFVLNSLLKDCECSKPKA